MPAFSTTSSAAVKRKSANCSSTIGRSPVSAAPTPAPTSAFSEIGVSKTRSSPNCSLSPAVSRKMPPKFATSSPYRMTERSRRISSAIASLMACAYVIVLILRRRLREYVLERALRLWERLCAHELDRLVDRGFALFLDLRFDRWSQYLRFGQLLLVARKRILAPSHLDFLARAIALRIADPMTPQPVRFPLDERWPLARTRALHRSG